MKEIKTIKINDEGWKEIDLPSLIWLNGNENQWIVQVDCNGERIEISKESGVTICSENDYDQLMRMLGQEDKNNDPFRIEIRETKKWGKKPLFKNGNNNVCFQVLVKNIEDEILVAFFNFHGTKSIESIYIHGIWLISRDYL
jgi:ABC-type bacteriocin/lantibiotic exporter with double-glycine peptidase domain